AKARTDLGRFRRALLLRFFKYAWLWVLLAAAVVGVTPLLPQIGLQAIPLGQTAIASAAGLALVLLCRFVAQIPRTALARAISESLAQARRLHDRALQSADEHYQRDVAERHAGFEATTARVDADLKKALAEASQLRVSRRMSVDEKAVRIGARWEEIHRARL